MIDNTAPPGLREFGIDSHWRQAAPADRRLLIVYAHPDDEAFGNAGTIIRYSDAGVAVHYACATRGECGTVDSELLDGYADVGALRTAEQLRAADALGLAAVHFLGYRDSGMVGSDDNQHPDALARAPTEQVAGKIVALIRALRPQVLVTFSAYGGYGHPDHIACHHATLAAFDAAGDPGRYPEQIAAGLEPWQPERLYYSTFHTTLLHVMVGVMRLLRRDPRRFGRNGDVDLVRALAEVTPVTTVVASADLLERKERAWACHHSQGGGPGRMGGMPIWLRRRFSAAEHFTRVRPAWGPGSAQEHSLFE